MLYQLHLGAVTLHLWERYTRSSLVAAQKPASRKSGKIVRITRFHYENLKFRKNTGTLLLCVEGSVHSEALNANAYRDCKRQCVLLYLVNYSLLAYSLVLIRLNAHSP